MAAIEEQYLGECQVGEALVGRDDRTEVFHMVGRTHDDARPDKVAGSINKPHMATEGESGGDTEAQPPCSKADPPASPSTSV